ncbi:hypothetical protein HD806DRAFT_475849 [Xylariaceae sp. AK1471]|nr:hypothetical protein HD806DRAFT_475849 [Xylariaceae sp. AK1471]
MSLMHNSNTPNRGRQQPTSSINTGHGHDDTTYNTALRGASLAFQKTTTKPPTNPSTSTSARYTGNGNGNGNDNGALIAATSASRDHSLSRSPSSLSRQTTGNNNTLGRDQNLAGHRSTPQHAHPTTTTGQSQLLTPAKEAMPDPRSPSFIAATLAASRSASPSPKPKTAPSLHPYAHQAVARGQPKGGVGDDSTASSAADLDLTTDTSSIGPANALISLFERKEDEVGPVKKSPAVSGVKKGHRVRPGLRPMTPPRTMGPVVTHDTSPSRLASALAWEKAAPSTQTTQRDQATVRSPVHIAGKTLESRRRPPTPPPARIKMGAELPQSTSLEVTKRKPRPATPPPQVISRSATVILSPQPRRTSSQMIITETLDKDPSSSYPPPTRSITQRQTSASRTTALSVRSGVDKKDSSILVRRSSSSLSNDTFVSASSAPSPQSDSSRRKSPRSPIPEVSRPLRPLSVHNTRLIPPPRPTVLLQRQSASHLPLDSLTNAIVAGSLASARATPSTVKPLTPPPRKATPHMRQTLRAPRTKSEEEEAGVRSQYGKKPLGKLSSRKKHSHHEGSRKRWREEITARERLRYEGVWASNRGLLLDSSSAVANGLQDVDTSLLVANVVVRDIWARSRLPFDELAEVWDLVDTQGKGVLDKAEFVVGMWLVDQRLRGRKTPTKVSDSVWGSAKGVRVIGPKVKRK